jgi:competence protein ComEC
MPSGILGVLAMPLGLDGYCWKLMGEGIDWMIYVALWVTSLPGAVLYMAAFGTGPLLLCSAGLVLFCLCKTPLRVLGVVAIGAAIVWAIRTPQPDVLVAADGSGAAIRGADGRLAVVKSGSDRFAVREWLAADADTRSPKDKALDATIRCDAAGCIGTLPNGSLVAIVRSVEAFEEDCRRAVVVVAAREAPSGCAALVIDRPVWRRTGAVALRRVDERFEITPACPDGYDRPWARALPQADDLSQLRRPARAAPRDATPNVEDLEPGD